MALPDCKPNKRDWLLCAAVLLSALLLGGGLWLAAPADGGVAVVMRDGAVLARLPLDTDAEYTVEGEYENVIRVESGAVFIRSATCPGEDCVRQGRVSRAGSSLICLPNRVTVLIEGGSADVVIG